MDRWFTRSEFWLSLAGAIGGAIQSYTAVDSTGSLIGGLLVAISTAVYTHGRSTIKARQK